MKIQILILVIALIVLLSCSSNNLPERPSYSRADKGRSNSFEEIEYFQTGLMRIKPIGELQRQGSITAPFIFNNGFIVTCSSDSYLILSNGTTFLWEYQIPDNAVMSSEPVADVDNNFYFATNDGFIRKIYDGKLVWERKLDKKSDLDAMLDLLIYEDFLYCGNSKTLAKFSLDGDLVWSKEFSSDILENIAISENGNTILSLSQNEFGKTDTLVVLNKEGIEVWKTSENEMRIIKPAISQGDYIYVVFVKNTINGKVSLVKCYDLNGREVWANEINIVPRNLSVSNDDHLYLAGYNSEMGMRSTGIFAFNNEGKRDWQIWFEYSVPTPLFISQKMIGFAGSNGKAYGLFHLDRSTGELLQNISLNDEEPILLKPSVYAGIFIFPSSRNNSLVYIDDNPITKILPY